MEKVIIFGIGDISQIAHLYLSEDTSYEVVAFTIDKEYIKEDTFLGLPVVDFENLEEKFSQNEYKLFIHSVSISTLLLSKGRNKISWSMGIWKRS